MIYRVYDTPTLYCRDIFVRSRFKSLGIINIIRNNDVRLK